MLQSRCFVFEVWVRLLAYNTPFNVELVSVLVNVPLTARKKAQT